MANWTGGRLTKAGRDLQIKVEAGRCKLELTKIKLGDGTEGVDATDNLTDLVGPKAVFGISSVVAKDGMCTVTGVISSSSVTAAFYAREWGLFAKDPDRGEILYMISLDPNPESIPPKTAALKQAATYAMNIVVSNAANIVANIDPAGLVTIKILQDYLSKKVSKNGDTMTGALTLPRLNFAYNSGFEMNKDGVIEITNGGSLYTAGKITAIGGFEGDVTGTADNTVKFVGKTFEQVKEDIGRGKANTNSPALTGTPMAPTAAKGTNTGQIATTAFVSGAVADLVGSSAAMLKTLRDLTTALGNDSNFAANINKMIAAKVSKSGDTMTGNLTLPRLNFGYDSGFEMNKNGLIEITNGGSLYTAGKITTTNGFEGDLVGTADNATKFAGKTFSQAKDEIKTQIAIITGQIAHDRTLPLPSGYSEGQCKWFVGVNSVSGGGAVRCYTDGRVVKCSDDKGSGTANYIVIGVK